MLNHHKKMKLNNLGIMEILYVVELNNLIGQKNYQKSKTSCFSHFGDFLDLIDGHYLFVKIRVYHFVPLMAV